MASNTGNRDFGRPSGPALEAMMAPAPADPTAAVEKELADRRLWASIWHDDDHARFVFAAYAERSVQPRHAFDRQVAAALAHGNREERLATIVVPTLVLHGTADNLITLGGGQRTAEAIPAASANNADAPTRPPSQELESPDNRSTNRFTSSIPLSLPMMRAPMNAVVRATAATTTGRTTLRIKLGLLKLIASLMG
jgi:hypothetical protein